MIRYAATSARGLRRVNNEDNLCVNSEVLPPDDRTEKMFRGEICEKKFPVFGVFDGIGGESCGEMASFTAANSLAELAQTPPGFWERLQMQAYVMQQYREMNRAVCDYASHNRIRCMGTTAVSMHFINKKAVWANLGDSRILEVRKGKLRQLSVDHSDTNHAYAKAPITQYLGIPEHEMLIEPAVGTIHLQKGDRYLLCSDGVTDMLSEKMICEILSESNSLEQKAARIKEQVFIAGARDNMTFVLVEVE